MKNDIKNIINEVLTKLEKATGIRKTREAEALIYETGNAETGYRNLVQMGGGPAVSFFQLEPATIQDIFNNYVEYRQPLVEVLIEFGLDPANLEFCVKTNIAIAICMCRFHYRRVPSEIPKTKEQRAIYWKEYYNTNLGKGTIDHFLKANKG
tara:strand:- start:1496 stop:1951 length:456 start_codon:yes stop_codon:yes gene_type:complete